MISDRRGVYPVIWQKNFAENCLKMREFGPKRGMRPTRSHLSLNLLLAI